MSEIKITSANFKQEVEQSSVPVLLDFWASWCGPCQMLAPALEGIAAEYAGRLNVGKINVDEEPELAGRFGIQSIPTLVLMENGTAVKGMMGYQNRDTIVSRLLDGVK